MVTGGELVPDADDGQQRSLRLVVPGAGVVVARQVEDEVLARNPGRDLVADAETLGHIQIDQTAWQTE